MISIEHLPHLLADFLISIFFLFDTQILLNTAVSEVGALTPNRGLKQEIPGPTTAIISIPYVVHVVPLN